MDELQGPASPFGQVDPSTTGIAPPTPQQETFQPQPSYQELLRNVTQSVKAARRQSQFGESMQQFQQFYSDPAYKNMAMLGMAAKPQDIIAQHAQSDPELAQSLAEQNQKLSDYHTLKDMGAKMIHDHPDETIFMVTSDPRVRKSLRGINAMVTLGGEVTESGWFQDVAKGSADWAVEQYQKRRRAAEWAPKNAGATDQTTESMRSEDSTALLNMGSLTPEEQNAAIHEGAMGAIIDPLKATSTAEKYGQAVLRGTGAAIALSTLLPVTGAAGAATAGATKAIIAGTENVLVKAAPSLALRLGAAAPKIIAGAEAAIPQVAGKLGSALTFTLFQPQLSTSHQEYLKTHPEDTFYVHAVDIASKMASYLTFESVGALGEAMGAKNIASEQILSGLGMVAGGEAHKGIIDIFTPDEKAKMLSLFGKSYKDELQPQDLEDELLDIFGMLTPFAIKGIAQQFIEAPNSNKKTWQEIQDYANKKISALYKENPQLTYHLLSQEEPGLLAPKTPEDAVKSLDPKTAEKMTADLVEPGYKPPEKTEESEAAQSKLSEPETTSRKLRPFEVGRRGYKEGMPVDYNGERVRVSKISQGGVIVEMKRGDGSIVEVNPGLVGPSGLEGEIPERIEPSRQEKKKQQAEEAENQAAAKTRGQLKSLIGRLGVADTNAPAASESTSSQQESSSPVETLIDALEGKPNKSPQEKKILAQLLDEAKQSNTQETAQPLSATGENTGPGAGEAQETQAPEQTQTPEVESPPKISNPEVAAQFNESPTKMYTVGGAVGEAISQEAAKTARQAMYDTRPAFYELSKSDPELADKVISRAAAPAQGRALAEVHKSKLARILKTKENIKLMGRLIRAAQIDRIEPEGQKINIEDLTPQEKEKVAKSPKLQEAIKYWKESFVPEVEKLAPEAGIQTFVHARDGLYGKLTQEFNSQEQSAFGLPSGPGKYRQRKAGASKQATGEGTYTDDLNQIIEHTILDRIVPVEHNRLNEYVRSKEVPIDPKTGNPVKQVQYKGKFVPVESVAVKHPFERGEDGKGGKEYVSVPAPVAEAYRKALEPNSAGDQVQIFKDLTDLATTLQITSPSEATGHAMNVFSVHMSQPGLGKVSMPKMGPLLANAPTMGISRMLIAAHEIGQVGGKGDEMQAMEDFKTIARLGGFRTAQWSELDRAREPGILSTTIKALEGVQKAPGLHALKGWVFDLPDFAKKGFFRAGLEVKARIATYRLLKANDPNLSDAQAVSMLNNEFGAYVQKLQSPLVQAIRKVPVLGTPFASAYVSIGKAGVKTLIGRGPDGKFSPERALLAPSLAVSWIFAQKALNGGYPWEEQNKGLQLGWLRIPLGKDAKGKEKHIDVSPKALFGGWERALRQTGVSTIWDQVVNQKTSNGQRIAVEWLENLGDQALLGATIGPAGKVVYAGLKGKAPFITKRGELLNVEEKSETNPLVKRLQAMGQAAVPSILEPFIGDARRTADTLGGKAAIAAVGLTGTQEKLTPNPEDYDKMMESKNKGIRQDVVQDIYHHALNLPSEKRLDYAMKRIRDDIDDTEEKKAHLVENAKKYFAKKGR